MDMDPLFQEIKKVCENCQKEFVITPQEQEMALEKGGKIERRYCRDCLKKWRKSEIQLEGDK